MNARPLDTAAVRAFPLTGLRLIEASAGTGKTYTIANLYLRHVLAGRPVRELLVVTFTKAATEELRGRIRARLWETLECLERGRHSQDAFLPELLQALQDQGEAAVTLGLDRLRLAVRAMDESAIFTIHGFCQRALSEFAFHSGQQFHMEVLTDDRDLWEEAVADWWRRAGYPLAPAPLRLFSETLKNLDAFRDLLRPLLGPQERRLLPQVGPLDAVLARLAPLLTEFQTLAGQWRQEGARLRQVLATSKGLSRAKESPYHPDKLPDTLARVDAYCATDPVLPPPEAFRVLTSGRLANHRLKKADPALDDPFFTACGRVWDALETLKRDLRAAALADAAGFARAQVRAAKQRAQALSFDDLLSELRQALDGPAGEALAEALRRQFPVAMIDEFQDTDPVQYGIFRRLYRDRPDLGLVLIGDPKQAIYSFRGGDIFTYMAAKGDLGPDSLYTLTTNWRSTPAVIQAVNGLFQRRPGDAFVYGEAIPFLPITPARKDPAPLVQEGVPGPALTLWTLPEEQNAKGEPKPLPKDQARELTHRAVAHEIARLIQAGRDGRARLGDRPLAPRDIAVLVRAGHEATALRARLAERGVHAVAVNRESVFDSEEAAGLEILLQAVLTPRDRTRARLALTASLLGHDYGTIERISQDENAWAGWVEQLLRLHQTWQRRGFMALFQQLLRGLEIAATLSRAPFAERRLTNLLHLGELLQQASKTQPGLDALLAWFRQQRGAASAEETELRLESDEALVRIVTIHASKGLEYPVVFVPYLWGCTPRDGTGLLRFHQDGATCLDAGSDAFETHLRLAEQERLAEDARLAYVALTRAAAALYLVWGRVGSKPGRAAQTALGYLLHPHQPGARLAQEAPDAFAGLIELGPDLAALAQAAPGAIRIQPLPQDAAAIALPPATPPPALAPRPFRGAIASDWRVSSFTALTRDSHGAPSVPWAEVDDDPALGFPAGAQVGAYLHRLLEHLDFQGDIEVQVERLSARFAPRFGLDHARWGADAAILLRQALHTPLSDAGPCLAQVPAARRLPELAFDFATRRVAIADLDRVLEQASGRAPPPLEAEDFQGMVTGIIDLVFEHAGRFYIADYKSTWLGPRLEDYQAERLGAAMAARRYDLQCLLYGLALHRYLQRRQPGYAYADHFGGIHGLFLRGMRPTLGPGWGVYSLRPAADLMETLDRRIFRRPVGDAP